MIRKSRDRIAERTEPGLGSVLLARGLISRELTPSQRLLFLVRVRQMRLVANLDQRFQHPLF